MIRHQAQESFDGIQEGSHVEMAVEYDLESTLPNQHGIKSTNTLGNIDQTNDR